jgi:predicted dehydrogenase
MSSESKRPDATNDITRRTFLRTGSLAAAALAGGSLVSGARAQETAGPTTALSANDRIGIGFIGVGGRGCNHLDYVTQLKKAGEKVEIAAVCDVYRPRVERAAKKYGGQSYMDHRELLADPNVDAVCIATPDHIHGYQVIDAVQAGKDVYCEKPVTHWRQFELTKRMAAEVKKSGRVFQLGVQYMSDTAWHQARKLVKDGLVGHPIHAEMGYFRVGDWGERGMPIDDPNAKPGVDLNWDAFLGDSPKRPFDVSRFFRWRMYEDYSGGPVTDLFPHAFTPAAWVLDVKMPSMVVATGGKFRYEEREVPDTFNMLIDYPEKFTVAILGTQGNDYPGGIPRGPLGRSPIIRGWEGTLTFEGNEIIFTPAAGSKKKAQRFPIEHAEDQLRFWQDFLTCCRTRQTQTPSPVDLAYHVQTALQMGALALRNGKVAKFDAAEEKIVL